MGEEKAEEVELGGAYIPIQKLLHSRTSTMRETFFPEDLGER